MLAELLRETAGGCIPKSGNIVPASRDDSLAVRTKGDHRQFIWVKEGLADGSTCGRLPQPGHPVRASGHNCFAVRAESCGMHHPEMSIELKQFLTRHCVPEATSPVATCCQDGAPIWANSHRPNLVLVPKRLANRPSGNCIP